MKSTKKLNDIKYGGTTIPNNLKLSRAQLSKLSKDQIDGIEPIYIRGIEGYLDENLVWKSYGLD